MPIDILMPALSPTMEEGALAKWHVKTGDKVKSGDVIAEIETDKATMEVEAVDEGVVSEILVPEGTEGVKVNSPIARLAAEGEAPAKGAPKAEAPKAEPAKAEPPKAEPPKPAPQAAAPPPKPEPAPAAPRPQPAAAEAAGGDGRIFASPLARRIAGEKGLDLSTLKGSGPHGRIVEADVTAAKPAAAPAPAPQPAAPKPAAAPVAAQPPQQVPTLEQQGIPPGSYSLVPLDGVRKVVARRLTDSFRDVPHFPLTIDLEIDRLLDARVRINAALESEKVKVSVNDLVLKACAAALMKVPQANASFTPQGVALHHHADISMAVAIEGGLITPIIRKCETKGLKEIALETKDLAERARTRKLKPEEFQGGTFSVSNLGMYGIRSFSSIINQPQGAILSVGAGEKRPVVRGDQIDVATVMTVTLTCDHRVVDGAVGAQWLAAFKTFIEDPITLIA
jgi:pyruvate dehydrogenase E2 component (dihydrolipoamide acetyltransferase)